MPYSYHAGQLGQPNDPGAWYAWQFGAPNGNWSLVPAWGADASRGPERGHGYRFGCVYPKILH